MMAVAVRRSRLGNHVHSSVRWLETSRLYLSGFMMDKRTLLIPALTSKLSPVVRITMWSQ